MTDEAYIPIPVNAAREIADRYAKAIVIVLSWDPVHGMIHTTTYGTTPQNKAWAAEGGEIATKALGGLTALATTYEDYRLPLERAAQGAWHLIQSLLACREGATDELLKECGEALRVALANSTVKPIEGKRR